MQHRSCYGISTKEGIDSVQSIERIVYAVLNHLNEQWGKKPLKEFTQND